MYYGKDSISKFIAVPMPPHPSLLRCSCLQACTFDFFNQRTRYFLKQLLIFGTGDSTSRVSCHLSLRHAKSETPQSTEIPSSCAVVCFFWQSVCSATSGDFSVPKFTCRGCSSLLATLWYRQLWTQRQLPGGEEALPGQAFTAHSKLI